MRFRLPRPPRPRFAGPFGLALVLAALVLGAPGGWGTGRTSAADPEFVVLIDGLCSTLSADQAVPAGFSGANGIADRLAAAGWTPDQLVAYSYRGGSVGADGRWQPKPYECADSRDQNIARDAEHLGAQLAAIAAAHPTAAFHLVGYSLGGLVAFGGLVRYSTLDGWQLPAGGRIATLVTLDSPIGGMPFVDQVCALAPDICGGTPVPAPGSSFVDMSTIWDSGTGRPAGGTHAVSAAIPSPLASPVAPFRNQQLAALAAADHGVRVLTIGNVRDWLYAPLGPSAGDYTFLDTQWLTSDAAGSGVYARAIDSGPSACRAAKGDLAASYGCNHALVTRDPAVGQAVVDLISGRTPSVALTCPAGRGGCLMLPPRPAVVVSSGITAGIVKTGGRFATSSVAVVRGSRATVLFTTKPALSGARIEIWARSQSGSYRFLTSRTADAAGVVRYYTPPVTAWTAYQARYAGDFVRGPGVSAGRVVTVR